MPEYSNKDELYFGIEQHVVVFIRISRSIRAVDNSFRNRAFSAAEPATLRSPRPTSPETAFAFDIQVPIAPLGIDRRPLDLRSAMTVRRSAVTWQERMKIGKRQTSSSMNERIMETRIDKKGYCDYYIHTVTAGVWKLKDSLSKYLKMVNVGERIVITGHNRIIAGILPAWAMLIGKLFKFHLKKEA